jgi:tetratricopeptide (TPR) repeat protein
MGRLLTWFAAEEDNLRAMLEGLSAIPSETGRAFQLLFKYWWARGAYMEARQRVREALDVELSEESRATLLNLLSKVEEELGNLDAAEDASDEAVATAESSGNEGLMAQAFRQSAWVKGRRGSRDDAVALARRAAKIGETLDEGTRIDTMHDLGALLGEAGHADEARKVFQQTMELARANDDSFLAISVLIQLGFIEIHEHRFDEARRLYAAAIERNREVGHYGGDMYGRWGLGYALLGLGQRRAAQETFVEGLNLVLAAPQTVLLHFGFIASGVAHAAEPDDARAAARLRGAVNSLLARRQSDEDPRHSDNDQFFDQTLIAAIGEEAWAQEQAAGAEMSLDEAIQLARSIAGEPSSQSSPGSAFEEVPG